MLQVDFIVGIFTIIVVVFALYRRRNNARSLSHLPLPPGPKGLPLIGNLRDMPSSFAWKTYHKWSKEL
ncbi:hypothetical protein CVT25_007426, partial [Psilocybe cyanescens]